MKPSKIKKFSDPLLYLKLLDNNTLIAVDTQTTVRYLNPITLELLSGFKANILHKDYANNVISFSNDGNYFATISEDTKESRLYNTQTKKMIAKVDRHHGSVSCVGIDPLGNYMFSGGDDGKTFVIDIKTGRLAFTMPMHIDTINDIAFNANSQLVATTSYDKKILLFNLAVMAPKHKLRAHNAAITKLLFLNFNRLVSVDKSSVAIVWDTHTGKSIARLEGIHDDVTQICRTNDGRFLFLGTKLGYILVYDLKSYQLISRKYIKLTQTITSLMMHDASHHLLIGMEDGTLQSYDIFQGQEQMSSVLKERRYTEIELLLENNPLLMYTKAYEVFSELWTKVYEKALYYLQKEDTASANKLFAPFKEIPSKNKIMQKTLSEFTEFSKFALLVKQGKIALAYSLVNAHPIYKESELYRTLESQWKATFTLAQKHLLDPQGSEKVKEIFAPYRGVSEKTKLIQELVTKSDVYKRFRVAIGQKDFVVAFELVRQNPFLKELSEYEVLMNYGDSLYIKAQKFLEVGDSHAAIKLLRVLKQFPDFAQDVVASLLSIENRQKFFQAITEKDYVTAYNILSEHEDIQELDEAKELQERWNSDIQRANTFALQGNVQGVKESLKEYMNISSKYAAIGTTIGWCYMVQLEEAVKAKKELVVIENGIRNYILAFGLQEQILGFYDYFKKGYPESKLNFELLTQGSLHMWRPAMIVNNILDS